MPEGSPSGGWREVYAEMAVETSAEAPTPPCPDCGDRTVRLARRERAVRFWCVDHGVVETVG